MKIPISAIHVYKFYFCDCFELSLSRAGEDKFKSHPCHSNQDFRVFYHNLYCVHLKSVVRRCSCMAAVFDMNFGVNYSGLSKRVEMALAE